MKKLRILWGILKRTRADHILLGFVLFLLADAAVIRLVEPDIHRYGDALWYCYAVISTAGFGDIVTVTLIGKICSVLLTIYTIFVVAIVTGVVVNFYTQLVEMQQKETLAMFMDKLERLPELSKEEKIRLMETRLKDAVRREEYEEAAKLRDEIRALKEEKQNG